MKKNLLLMLMSVLLFVQCKKNEIDEEKGEDEDMVTITLELSANDFRSDFSDIFSESKINWGNKNGDEYLYLSVGPTHKYYSEKYKDTVTAGELIEMYAYAEGPCDKLMFRGKVKREYLYPGKECKLYYFGIDGRGDGAGIVKNIYDPELGVLIGKTIDYSIQYANIDMMGFYHIASSKVSVGAIIMDLDVAEYVLFLEYAYMENLMTIAMLDLKGEKVLEGNATLLQTYTVKWDGLNHELVESYDFSSESSYKIYDEHGPQSLVALLPVDKKVYLQCRKGIYVFEEGIKRNHLYVGKLGTSVEDTQPLTWKPVKP